MRKRRPDSKAKDAEYRRFAEQLTDGILDPKQPWLVQWVLTGGLANIPTDEELSSGTQQIGDASGAGGSRMVPLPCSKKEISDEVCNCCGIARSCVPTDGRHPNLRRQTTARYRRS